MPIDLKKKRERDAKWKRAHRSLRKHKALVLAGGACVDCGETDLRVIEFDHVRGQKLGHPSLLPTSKFFEEVTLKCEPVCANCHRRRTIERWSSRRESTYQVEYREHTEEKSEASASDAAH